MKDQKIWANATWQTMHINIDKHDDYKNGWKGVCVQWWLIEVVVWIKKCWRIFVIQPYMKLQPNVNI